MALPALYKNITLCSYNTIRYRDDRPEGLGSSSPFAMGLNALVTRDVAGLVRSLTLQGQWKEHDLQEFSAAGRVPDDAMMLNIAVRAAVDRCSGIESFKSVMQNFWQPHHIQLSYTSQVGFIYKALVKCLLWSSKPAKTIQSAHSLPFQPLSSTARRTSRNEAPPFSDHNGY